MWSFQVESKKIKRYENIDNFLIKFSLFTTPMDINQRKEDFKKKVLLFWQNLKLSSDTNHTSFESPYKSLFKSDLKLDVASQCRLPRPSNQKRTKFRNIGLRVVWWQLWIFVLLQIKFETVLHPYQHHCEKKFMV